MSDFIPFAFPDIGQAEIDEVVDSLRSGWITTGPKVARFEQRFAAFMGSDVQALAVNSATAGLHLALEALGIGPGDEVIVPVHTFTATAEVVAYLGARPVFVDVEPLRLTIDPVAVERAITARTRAIIPVHYAGLAVDMDPLILLARRHGLKIVEDAAHALPTTYGGRLVGTLDTDATVFSFYATKTLATGEGGMVVLRDPALARRIQVMRLHGIDRNVFDRYQGKGGGWHYSVVAPGYKYNLTDLAAAMGLHQLARLQEMQAKRQAIAARYDAAFADLPLAPPPHAEPDGTHAWHLYVVQLLDEAPLERGPFIEAMREQGVGCSVHYVPLQLQPYWRQSAELDPADFPVSTAAFHRLVSLPIYSSMSESAVRGVIHAVRTLLG